MTFAFICDNFFQKRVAADLVSGEIPNHNIITITADDILQSGKLPDNISGVIIERGTWQKNFSMFRYFGMLPLFENKNIAFVAMPDMEFKGRYGMKGREFIISPSINAEEASAQLSRLTELTPPTFTHHKSRAIA